MRTLRILALLLSAMLASGCCLFRPTNIVKHPDAPMLIGRTKRGYAEVSVYEKAGNRLIVFGWIRISEAHGWTLQKFDWEAHLAKQARERELQPE